MKLTIGLSSWIIQDGNFSEIAVGSEHRLALKFYAKDGLRQTRGLKALRHVQGATYDITAEVIGIYDEAWVLDCGLRLLRDVDAPKGTLLGNFVAGRVYIGVDPFWYLEQISGIPGAPELWYAGRVERIHLDVTRRSASLDSSGRQMWSREGSVDSLYQEIAATNSSTDDGGNADYLLEVTLLSGPGV